MKTQRNYRRTVIRRGRRYELCGLRTPQRFAERHREPTLGIWLPGMTFVLVLMFSAFLIGRPAGYPLGNEGVTAHANFARFTINDFANASR